MKAWVLHGINDLRYDEIGKPNCPKGWAIVKIKACGICSSDIARVFTKGTYHFPTIPGHEFSGDVESVADKENEYIVGKRVGIFPLIPCKSCEQCKKKHYEMCSNYDYLGSRRDGGFAEYVAVPVWNLIELPDNVSYKQAAMLEPLSVALHAMKRAELNKNNKNETVGIIGTGMIGISAAQWAKKLGAKSVCVIGRSQGKKELVKRFEGVDYKSLQDCDETEFDVLLEAVGTNDAVNFAITHTKAGGNIVLMGNPAGDMQLSQNIYWRILRKQLTLTGTWNSQYENGSLCDWSEVLSALSNNEIQTESLISHCFEQHKLIDGLKMMREHKEPYCKVMTLWNMEE